MSAWPYIDPVEDTESRAPEWQPVELAPGQFTPVVIAEWDPVHDYRRTTGPLISIDPFDPVHPY